MPKISAFFPSSRGMCLLLSACYYLYCTVSFDYSHIVLSLNRISPAKPSVHTISQVVNISLTRQQCNFGSDTASISHGTHKDDIFVFWNVQIFECLPK